MKHVILSWVERLTVEGTETNGLRRIIVRKDYEEKIEQGKEYVKEHKDGVKKVLFGAGLFGAGMIFGVKLYDKSISASVSKT